MPLACFHTWNGVARPVVPASPSPAGSRPPDCSGPSARGKLPPFPASSSLPGSPSSRMIASERRWTSGRQLLRPSGATPTPCDPGRRRAGQPASEPRTIPARAPIGSVMSSLHLALSRTLRSSLARSCLAGWAGSVGPGGRVLPPESSGSRFLLGTDPGFPGQDVQMEAWRGREGWARPVLLAAVVLFRSAPSAASARSRSSHRAFSSTPTCSVETPGIVGEESVEGGQLDRCGGRATGLVAEARRAVRGLERPVHRAISAAEGGAPVSPADIGSARGHRGPRCL